MGILSRLKGPFEKRVSIDDPHYWPNIFGKLFGTQTLSNIDVNFDKATTITTVFACVTLLSEIVASLPLMVYRKRKDGGKDVADGHWAYELLHDKPNEFQTSFEHREMYMGHLELTGNAFDFLVRNGNGQIIEIVPLDPGKVQATFEDNGPGKVKLSYQYKRDTADEITIPTKDIWHKRGMALNRYFGVSRIEKAKEAMALALAAEGYGSKFFSNAARPSGILKVAGKLNEDQEARLKRSWQDAQGGLEGAFKVALLQGDLDWKPISENNEKSQFFETREFQVQEIARLFRVPSVLIGHPDKTMTYASVEQLVLAFKTFTIAPIVIRLEQSMNHHILTEDDRKKGFFVQHKLENFVRADIATRYQAYEIARRNMWMSANEIRALENMDPIEGGDEFINPNTQSMGSGEDALSE